jgi:hypothetical protein
VQQWPLWSTHRRRSELRPLVVAREPLAADCLERALCGNKIEGKRGFHLKSPQGRTNPIKRRRAAGGGPPPPFNIVPTQQAAAAALAALHSSCCTLNLNLQLHKCCHASMLPCPLAPLWPYRPQILTDLTSSGRSGPRIMLPLYPSTPRASRRSGSQGMEAVTLEARTPRSQTSIPVTKKRQYDQKRDEKRIPKEI